MKKRLCNLLSKATLLMSVLSLWTFHVKAQNISGPTCIDYNNASPISYFLGLSGISNVSWSTAGDIKIVGSTTGTSVTINSQSTEPGRQAYGKGRLTVSYTVDTIPQICGPRTEHIDIYKIFQANDEIVGPKCVATGDTVTYSIKPEVSVNLSAEIGIDNYKWIIPASWVPNIQYYSADSSSITFIVGTVSGSDSIVVGIGRCNISSGVYTDTLALGKKIPKPILSYPSCLSIDLDTLVVKWTNPPVSGVYTYTWSKPSNWKTLFSSQDSIVLVVDDNPGVVKLSVLNTCQKIDTSVTINRTLGSKSRIVGDSCVHANSRQVYTIANAPINTDFKWTIPSGDGWSFANNDTTAQTIIVNVGTISDTIFVTTEACSSVVAHLVVNIRPENPIYIKGDTCLDAGKTDSLTFKVNTVNYAQGYGWIFPDGWSPSATTTNDTIVKVKPDGETSGLVKVFALGCKNSDTISLNVNYSGIQPDSILIPTCINAGIADTVTFSIYQYRDGQTYEWIIPNTWTKIGATTDSTQITVRTDGVQNTYYVKARARNSCGVSPYDSVQVKIQGLAFNVTTSTFSGLRLFGVDPSPVSGATNYVWYFNGLPNSSGPTATGIAISSPPASGTGCVYVYNAAGCVTYKCASYGNALRTTSTNESNEDFESSSFDYINVYPNPAGDEVTVQFDFPGQHTISIVSWKGEELLTKTGNSRKEKLNISNIASGQYLLVIKTEDGMTTKNISIVH